MSAGSTITAPRRFISAIASSIRRVDALVEAGDLARHPDARAPEALGIEEPRVVLRALRVRAARWRRRAGSLPASAPRRIAASAHRARHRPGGVLAVGDGDDARAADQPQRGLDPHDARWTTTGRRWSRRSPCPPPPRTGSPTPPRAEPGAGPAGVAVERVGVAALAAARAPAAARPRGADVRPLAQVGLAQRDRARGAQPLHDEGVAGRARALEGERAGGGRGAVAGVDVVLDQDREAVQRAAGALRPALGVERVGDGQRVGVGLDDAAQLRPAAIEGVDAVEVGLGQRARGQLPGGHSLLEIGERGFDDVVLGGRGQACRQPVRRHRRRSRARGAQEHAPPDPAPPLAHGVLRQRADVSPAEARPARGRCRGRGPPSRAAPRRERRARGQGRSRCGCWRGRCPPPA